MILKVFRVHASRVLEIISCSTVKNVTLLSEGDTLLDTSTPQNLDMDMATTNNKPKTSVTIYCKIYFKI